MSNQNVNSNIKSNINVNSAVGLRAMKDVVGSAKAGAAVNNLNAVILDASSLAESEELFALKEYVKLECIEFFFPNGLAEVDVLTQCRALCDLQDFDNLYDLTMSFLSGKEIIINLKLETGEKKQLGSAFINDKFFNLNALDCIAEYPILVNWLVEFIAGRLAKKFPMPTVK